MADRTTAVPTAEVTVPDKGSPQRPVRMTPADVAGIIEMLPSAEREQHAKLFLEKELERQTFETDQRLARILALSGEFNDLKDKSPEQAFATMVAKIVYGRSIGLEPGDSTRFIYFTNGKPNVENDIVASKLAEAGYAWDEDWQWAEETYKGKPWKRCTGCTLWLKKWDAKKGDYVPVVDRKGNPVSESFTEADADHALVWEKGKQISLSDKFNYKSWPREMYYFRTIGRIRKFHVPHVLRGAMTRVEALDVTPMDAPAIAAPAETEPAAAPAGRTVRDIVMGQEPFFETPAEETPAATKEKKS